VGSREIRDPKTGTIQQAKRMLENNEIDFVVTVTKVSE